MKRTEKHSGRRRAGLLLTKRIAGVLARNGFDLCDLYYRMSFRKKSKTFSAAGVGNLWRGFLEKKFAASGGLMNLYVNIPFCKTKCDFCGFFAKAGAEKAEINRYTEALIEELEYFGNVFAGTKINHLYIGGTPSCLDNRELERLFKAVFSAFIFTPEGIRIFECAPSTLTFSKLALTKKYGLNRINMGVQSLDEKVLLALNRPQKSSHVMDLIGKINASGFEYGTNVDLILGLFGEGLPGFLRSFARIAAGGPETISVYDLCPVRGYVSKFYGNDGAAARGDIARMRAGAEGPMKAIAKKAGYILTCRNKDREWVFCKKESFKKYSIYTSYSAEFSPAPVSTLGAGSGARSLMYGYCGYIQREGIMREFTPGAGVFSGEFTGKHEEMLKFIFVAFRTGEPVSLALFKKRFSEDLLLKFRAALADLEAMGCVKITDKQLILKCSSPEELLFCGLHLIGLEGFLKEILPSFPGHITKQVVAEQAA